MSEATGRDQLRERYLITNHEPVIREVWAGNCCIKIITVVYVIFNLRAHTLRHARILYGKNLEKIFPKNNCQQPCMGVNFAVFIVERNLTNIFIELTLRVS